MLNMNPVVLVNVSVGATSTVSTVFDVGAILTSEAGTGTPLTTTSRFASYSSLDELLAGVTDTKPAFADTTATYAAAVKYFGTNPAPRKLVVIFFDTAVSTTDTPVLAVADAIDKGAEFYGLYYIPKADETAANIKTYIGGIASAFDALGRGMVFYGVTGTVSSVTTAGALMPTLFDAGSKRAIGMLCNSAVNDAAGLMGEAMGLTAAMENAPFSLCYKGIATATATDISQTDVASIKAINGNVFVARTKAGAKLENGSTASGLRYDEMLYTDMISNDIQESIYDLIANSATKLPQTDSTSSKFVGEICRILEDYYGRGILADNIWRGMTIGTVERGDMIEHGYMVLVDSFDTQSDVDRAAHKAMPITVIVCLSGSVENIVINLNVQT